MVKNVINNDNDVWVILKRSNIIVQPLSMRIIRLLINNELSTKEIKNILNDIPQATLYRHIKKMHNIGLLKVVKEEIIKGIIKKTYTFEKNSGMLNKEDIQKMSTEEYEDLFMQFITVIIGDFKNNLENNKSFKEEISFSQAPIYLSEKELMDMDKEITQVLKKYLDNKKTEDRKQRLLSFIFMSGDKD